MAVDKLLSKYIFAHERGLCHRYCGGITVNFQIFICNLLIVRVL